MANDTLQHSALFHNIVHPLSLPGFLLVRGPYAFLGNAWAGCNTFPPHRPSGYDADYGEPLGHCEEVALGVFKRNYTKAVVEIDCNIFNASIMMRSLPAKTDDLQNKNNILLITVDDLRPQLGAYGMSETLTPNVDALASSGLLFQRAYCQMAVCSPSRNSFMSGRRPDTTKVWNFVGSFRDVGPTWVTMPQYFKMHGFLTYGFGKLYHPGSPPNDDFPTSWSPNDFGGLNDSYYWGNQQPIGDAGWCDRYTENNTRLNLQGDPVAWSFNGAWSCHNINDTLALTVRAFSIHVCCLANQKRIAVRTTTTPRRTSSPSRWTPSPSTITASRAAAWRRWRTLSRRPGRSSWPRACAGRTWLGVSPENSGRCTTTRKSAWRSTRKWARMFLSSPSR